MASSKKDKLNAQGRYGVMFGGLSKVNEPTPASEPAPIMAEPTPPPAPAPASTQEAPEATATLSPAPPPRALPKFGEDAKSRRLQLLMQPRLHDALKVEAGRQGRSVNDLIHGILEEYVRRGQ